MNTLCSMRRKKRPRRLPSGMKNLSCETNSLTTYQVLQSLCCYLIVDPSTVRDVSILEYCVSMLSFCVCLQLICGTEEKEECDHVLCHFHFRSRTVHA